MNKEDKERLVKLLEQNKLTRVGSFALHTYIRDLEDCNKEKDKEIERLNNIIELATYYIDNYMYENYAYCGSEDRLKQILSGNNFILKQLKELKGSDK